MHAVKEVVAEIEAHGAIEAGRVRQWMMHGDLPTRGAVYRLTNEAWSRITPELGGDEQCDFMAAYLIDCIVVDPQLDDDSTQGGFEAAWELAAWLKHLLTIPNTGSIIRRVATKLREAYKTADTVTRNRIATGALEHILEAEQLVSYFDDWRNDPTLRQDYELALNWGRAHPWKGHV